MISDPGYAVPFDRRRQRGPAGQQTQRVGVLVISESGRGDAGDVNRVTGEHIDVADLHGSDSTSKAGPEDDM